MTSIRLIDLDFCEGHGAQGSVGRVADAAADTDRPLHHLVPAEEGPTLAGGPRFHVREEPAPVQTGAAGVRELRLSRRRAIRGRFAPENGATDGPHRRSRLTSARGDRRLDSDSTTESRTASTLHSLVREENRRRARIESGKKRIFSFLFFLQHAFDDEILLRCIIRIYNNNDKRHLADSRLYRVQDRKKKEERKESGVIP